MMVFGGYRNMNNYTLYILPTPTIPSVNYHKKSNDGKASSSYGVIGKQT